MKITIKANEIINETIINQLLFNGENVGNVQTKATSDENKKINQIEIDFSCSPIWTDLEIWLEDDNGKQCDYMRLNVSKTKKLKASK